MEKIVKISWDEKFGKNFNSVIIKDLLEMYTKNNIVCHNVIFETSDIKDFPKFEVEDITEEYLKHTHKIVVKHEEYCKCGNATKVFPLSLKCIYCNKMIKPIPKLPEKFDEEHSYSPERYKINKIIEFLEDMFEDMAEVYKEKPKMPGKIEDYNFDVIRSPLGDPPTYLSEILKNRNKINEIIKYLEDKQ